MTDLADFLLARIAEDKAAIDRYVGVASQHNGTGWEPRWSVARLVAECEAKRRIVEEAFLNAEDIDGEWGDGHLAAEIRAGACNDRGAESAARFLRLLALPYADHPDYREEWRP